MQMGLTRLGYVNACSCPKCL